MNLAGERFNIRQGSRRASPRHANTNHVAWRMALRAHAELRTARVNHQRRRRGRVCLASQRLRVCIQRAPRKGSVDRGWIDDLGVGAANPSRLRRSKAPGNGSHPPSISATVRAFGEGGGGGVGGGGGGARA